MDGMDAWKTPLGKDCTELGLTLATWLGLRLVFLAWYIDQDVDEEFREELTARGESLLLYAAEGGSIQDAQKALHWVADNMFWLCHCPERMK